MNEDLLEEQNNDYKRQWEKVFKAIHKAIGDDKLKVAYDKKKALQSAHLLETLDNLGYMSFANAQSMIYDMFRDGLPLLRIARASAIQYHDDVNGGYFAYNGERTNICFIPLSSPIINQTLLSYDDYIFVKKNANALDASKEGSTTFANFTFEDVVNAAVAKGASDIHIIPKEEFYHISFKINGDLVEQEVFLLDIPSGKDFVYKIKLDVSQYMKGSFNLDKNTSPQDGRVVYNDVEARLIFIPDGVLGDRMTVTARVIKRIVIRKTDLSRKGFSESFCRSIDDQSKREGGMILVSGITSSGKSTLVVEILGGIDQTRRIYTIENPIEYVLVGKNITQHQIFIPPKVDGNTPVDGMGYKEFTAAIKRGDANVVFVGEMRNDKTLVKSLFEMANAGQLIFTTAHFRSAFEVYHSLEQVFEMQFKSVVPLIFMSINTKLVKCLCDECKVIDTNCINADRLSIALPKLPYEYKASADHFIKHCKGFTTYLRGGEKLDANKRPERDENGKTIPCPKCQGAGYEGRVPLYEYFEPDVEMIEYILKQAPSRFEIEARACQKRLGQNRLDVYVEKLKLGLIDTSPEILKAIL